MKGIYEVKPYHIYCFWNYILTFDKDQQLQAYSQHFLLIFLNEEAEMALGVFSCKG